MSDKKEKWEPCPRCGSNRTEARGIGFYLFFGFCLIGVSIWLLIIPPLGIAGIVVGLAIMLVAPLMKNNFQCKDCNHNWKYPASKEQAS